MVKKVMGDRLKPFLEQDLWRIDYLAKMLERRGEDYHVIRLPGRQWLDIIETTELADSLCKN